MKKSALASALALSLGFGVAQAATMTSATFTMLDGSGGTVGVDTTVTGDIGGGTFSVASTTAFFGQQWTAHSGVTFGPGTYTIDTIQGPVFTGIEVGAGQVGGHILFNWGVSSDIDVVNVWDVSCGGGFCTYTSTDVDGNSFRGLGMIDGPFQGFNANFDFVIPDTSEVPVPAAVWLLGSGLLGLVGVARRKKAA